jgi:hypothetical protein
MKWIHKIGEVLIVTEQAITDFMEAGRKLNMAQFAHKFMDTELEEE